MEPWRLTPYIEECIQNLSEKAECQADRTMACLARLQIIVGQIPSNCGVQCPTSPTPVRLYIKALQAQLQALRKDISQELGQNSVSSPQPTSYCLRRWLLTVISPVIVLLHYYGVETNVLELVLSMPATFASVNSQDFHRLETLHSGLKAVQALFDTYLALPAYFARNISFFTYTQIAKSLVFLHKLSTFESPDWDLDYVRETVGFGNILDQLIGWFENVKITEGITEPSGEDAEDMFSRCVRKLSRIKAWHEQRTRSGSLGPEPSTTIPHGGATMTGDSMNFLNDTWLEEVLGNWDSQYNDGSHNSIWRGVGHA